jgi:hypothetical protein
MMSDSHEDLLTELGGTDSESARKEQLSAGSGVERVEPDGIQATSIMGTPREHWFTRSTILAAIDEAEQAILDHPVMSRHAKSWATEGVRDVRAKFGCRFCGSTSEGAEGAGTHMCRTHFTPAANPEVTP